MNESPIDFSNQIGGINAHRSTVVVGGVSYISLLTLSAMDGGLIITYTNPNVATKAGAVGVFEISLASSDTSGGTSGLCGMASFICNILAVKQYSTGCIGI